MTQRWKLTIEYDGAGFVGWQRQEAGLFSVQECLETAIHAFSGETVVAHAAGRTDAGVHAAGQVVHIDLGKEADEETVRDAINFHMRPHAAAVARAEKVSSEFHARFTAVKRAYLYRIVCARSAPPVIDAGRVWHVWQDLDVAAMNEAARHLLGAHDFSSFRAAECQAKTPQRTLDRLEFEEVKSPAFGRHLALHAEARSFLHHQVRNMTGTLKLVGEGKWKPADVKAALQARDRKASGPTAPACGLCFVRVEY
jgi:tRNA pseudouridine38-40 synthase